MFSSSTDKCCGKSKTQQHRDMGAETQETKSFSFFVKRFCLTSQVHYFESLPSNEITVYLMNIMFLFGLKLECNIFFFFTNNTSVDEGNSPETLYFSDSAQETETWTEDPILQFVQQELIVVPQMGSEIYIDCVSCTAGCKHLFILLQCCKSTWLNINHCFLSWHFCYTLALSINNYKQAIEDSTMVTV